MNKMQKKNLITVLKATNDRIKYLLEAFEIPERIESMYLSFNIYKFHLIGFLFNLQKMMMI